MLVTWDQISNFVSVYIVLLGLQQYVTQNCKASLSCLWYRRVLLGNMVTHFYRDTRKFKPLSCRSQISAVLPTENGQHGSYDTVSWAGMNKLVKIRIDPKPELAIPIWYLYLSMHMCLQECVFSAVCGNQLELSLSLLLIFQPIVMKHCCEGLLNNLLSAQDCLLLFSWIPLLKLAQRLHCAWVWRIKGRNRKLYIQETVLRVRSISQEKKNMTPCLNICHDMYPLAWKWAPKLFHVWSSDLWVRHSGTVV